MYEERDLLPISALQHLLVCPRQCALIYVERVWEENLPTVEGRLLHERVHAEGDESRADIHIARGLQVRSLRLGLFGVADMVEFAPDGTPFPVEYKRGRPKAHDADKVQLCAQAMSLEEMTGRSILCGALYYGETRRRFPVDLTDAALRETTQDAARRLHALCASGRTPPPLRGAPCRGCSLREACLPRARGRSVAAYMASSEREEVEP